MAGKKTKSLQNVYIQLSYILAGKEGGVNPEILTVTLWGNRVKDGNIVPIEFNPLRFAGWCCTDLGLYAYGFLTVEYYLRNQAPDWERLLEKKKRTTIS